MKFIPPIHLKDRYYISIRSEIQKLLNEILYKPLNEVIMAAFPKVEIKNQIDDPLYNAILQGVIWYQDGLFRGSFNSRTSKRLRDIGATFNMRSGTYSLPNDKLPDELRMADADQLLKFGKLTQDLLRTLENVDIESINYISDIPDKYMQSIEWMDDDFRKAVREIAIVPQLTADQQGIMAAEWGQNLDKYVKDWAAENILELRKDIQSNAFGGRRPAALVDYIKSNYGVGQRKAEFLARQETSLLMSKFHEVRYGDMGITKYKWSTAHDQRTRHDHAILDGKVFDFEFPPVVDERTGRRANPGEDYGCRCVAIAIVE